MIQSGRKTAVNNHLVDEDDGLEEYMPDKIDEGNEHFRNEEDDQVEHLLTNENKRKGQLDKEDDGVDRVLDKDVQDEHLLDTESDFESVNKHKKSKENLPKMKNSAQDVDTEKRREGCKLAAHCLEDKKNNILFDSSAVLKERFDPRANKPDLDLSNIKMPPKILKRG